MWVKETTHWWLVELQTHSLTLEISVESAWEATSFSGVCSKILAQLWSLLLYSQELGNRNNLIVFQWIMKMWYIYSSIWL